MAIYVSLSAKAETSRDDYSVTMTGTNHSNNIDKVAIAIFKQLELGFSLNYFNP